MCSYPFGAVHIEDFRARGNVREWIARHIETTVPLKSTRKQKTLRYYLPKGEENDQYRLCKAMFLNTLGISGRQIRTVTKKIKKGGVLENEKRAGRQSKQNDASFRDDVKQDIERFPKMASHYCRANSSYHYLSSDLNATKMYGLYMLKNTRDQKLH